MFMVLHGKLSSHFYLWFFLIHKSMGIEKVDFYWWSVRELDKICKVCSRQDACLGSVILHADANMKRTVSFAQMIRKLNTFQPARMICH